MLELWRGDIHIPLAYRNDALSASVYTKGMLDTGWYTENALLGAPWGMILYGYPSLHTLHFAVMKVMALFLTDYASLMNSYYLITFPLVGVAALLALRHFGIAYPVAAVGAVLFSVTPYHFTLGGIGELFLSGYFAVPLTVMLSWWIACGGREHDAGGDSPIHPCFRWPRNVWGMSVCVLIGLSHIYYVVFSVPIVIAAGVWSALWRRRAAPFVCALAVCLVIGAVVLANHLPVLAHARSSGLNPAALGRDAGGPLRHGLRIASLLIPATTHGSAWLEELQRVHADALRSELVRGGAYLGVAGVLGFVLLLVQLLLVAAGRVTDPRMRLLAVLNIVLLLLAVVGGFGYVFGLAVVPVIRYYSRVTVYIAFLGVAATFLLIDRWLRRLSTVRFGVAISSAFLSLLVVAGTIDQKASGNLPAYAEIERQYRTDEAFVAAIERALPDSAAVFQLPHVSFPEGTGKHRMKPYDPATMYLHSTALRWSFGTMRGQPGSLWLERVAERPTQSLLEGLCLIGYGGICVDRDGYPDDGTQIMGDLRAVLGEAPLESKDGRRAFFPLLRYRRAMEDSVGPEQWEAMRAKEHLLLARSSGFGQALFSTARRWHWCEQTGELLVHNLSDRTIHCQIVVWLRAPHVESAELLVEGPVSTRRAEIGSRARRFMVAVSVPPGENAYRFRTDAPNDAVAGHAGYRAFLLFGPEILHAGWEEDADLGGTREGPAPMLTQAHKHGSVRGTSADTFRTFQLPFWSPRRFRLQEQPT